MEFICPRLICSNDQIVTLPNVPSLQKILFVDNEIITTTHNENDNKETITLSFNVLSLYSSLYNTFNVIYKRNTTINELNALLFLLKYKSPELYNKKLLIKDAIYEPYLHNTFKYDSFKVIENDNRFKGGVYCVAKTKISGRDCYISGGWIFAVYDIKDITYRNIITNSWDECVMALALLPPENKDEEMQIITGDNNGEVKLWKVKSFHNVISIKHVTNKFKGIIKIHALQNESDCFVIIDKYKFEIWNRCLCDNVNDENRFEINENHHNDDSDNNEIVCSNYEYIAILNKHFLFIADKNNYIYHFEILSNRTYILLSKFYNNHNSTPTPILSLKYYPKHQTLFIGCSNQLQIWNCSSLPKYTMNSFYTINDPIHNIHIYSTNKILYLFCCGNKQLHIMHYLNLNP